MAIAAWLARIISGGTSLSEKALLRVLSTLKTPITLSRAVKGTASSLRAPLMPVR